MSADSETSSGSGLPLQDRPSGISCSGIEEEFEYTPLADPTSQIRLLRVLPGRDSDQSDDKIECSLEIFSLADFENHPTKIQDDTEPEPGYSALSYTWGHQEGGGSILCNGKIFYVWPNLMEALRYLRVLDWVDLIWIDAICINQHDDEEKSAQVSSMAKIYSYAKQTVVWLGVPPFGSAVQAVTDLHDLLPWDKMQNLFSQEREGLNPVEAFDFRSSFTTEGISPAEVERRLSTLDWLSLYAPFCEPWFTRKWVIQEVALARQVYMVYGFEVLDWTGLRAIIDHKFRSWSVSFSKGPLRDFVLDQNWQTSYSFDSSLPDIDPSPDSKNGFFDRFGLGFQNALMLTTNMAGGKPLGALPPENGTESSCINTLESTLMETRNFQVTDIRDSLYSILSLCSRDGCPAPLTPDYKLKPQEVLWQALNLLIDKDHGNMQPYGHGSWCSLRCPKFERQVILPESRKAVSRLSNPLSWLSFYKIHRSRFHFTGSSESRRTLLRIYALLIKTVNLYFKPQRGVDVRWVSLIHELFEKWCSELDYRPQSLGVRRHSIIDGEPVDIWAHPELHLDAGIRFQRRNSM